MLDFATKVDNVGDTLSAEEFNNYIGELENCITTAGLTLDPDPAVVNQLAQAIAIIAGSGTGVYKVKSDSLDTSPDFLGAKVTSLNGSVNTSLAGATDAKLLNLVIEPVAQANAEGGLVNDKAMTPLRTQQFDQKRKYVGTSLPASTVADPVGTVYYIYA